MVGTIIVDSNILIFGESKNSPEHLQASLKYKSATESGRIGINVIIASEVFHNLQRIFGSVDAYLRLNAILCSPSVDFLELGLETVTRAAKLARDFSLRINDAIIAQQAIEMGVPILTDDVKDFGKIGSIKVIPLRTS